MRGVRRQSREAALQAVFMCDFNGRWTVEEVAFCFDHFNIPEQARPYAEKLVCGLLQEFNDIDERITCASEHWSMNRMGRVDRCLLRIATYELMYCDDIPLNVAINEAIEIAKSFGSEDSPMFINGVLDKIAANLRGIEKESVPSKKQRDAVQPEVAAEALADNKFVSNS